MCLSISQGPGSGVVGGHRLPLLVRMWNQPGRLAGGESVLISGLARQCIALYWGPYRLRRLLEMGIFD